MIPPEMKVMLAADRFYGTSSLISLCQQLGWQYRIRLKGNLILHHQSGEIKTGELVSLALNSIEDAELNNSGVRTCVGALMEAGYDEPWIVSPQWGEYWIMEYVGELKLCFRILKQEASG